MAVANYHDTYGVYPPAYLADAEGRPMHSWRVLLLPFLERRDLYDKYDFSQPWNSAANQQLAEQMPATYALHGEYRPGSTTTNYLAVVGENTLWPGAAARKSDEVSDEHASSIMIVENRGQEVHWMEPRDLSYVTMSWRINSPQGISSKYDEPAVAMLDCTLRKLGDELPEDTLRALLTVNGGEQLADEGDTWRLLPDGRLRALRETDTDARR